MPSTDPLLFPADDQNPYAPPLSELEPELAHLELKAGEFSIGDVLTRSWEIYRDRMGISIGVASVFLIIVIVLYIVSLLSVAVVQNMEGVAAKIAGIVGYLTSLVLTFWISLGLFRVMLDVATGREASIGGLFGAGRFLWRAVLAILLFYLGTVGIVLLGCALGGLIAAILSVAVHASTVLVIALMILGGCVSYIGVLILSLRFSQSVCLIVDRDASVLDSLRNSFQITRGHAGSLFVLYLIACMIYVGGAMACGIGLFFALPYIMLMFVVSYLALTGQAIADPHAKGEPLAKLEPL